MLHRTPPSPGHASQSAQRQVKAMLRLVRDLGYEVLASPAGDWIVAARDDRGDCTVVGFDSVSEVVAAARKLADSFQTDRRPIDRPARDGVPVRT